MPEKRRILYMEDDEGLGRLLQQHWRAGGAFDVRIEPRKDPTGRSRLTVTWQRNARWGEWARLSEGCYLLGSNLTETDPCTLWKRYIQLTEAEWDFRIHKDELENRPIWHQKAERVIPPTGVGGLLRPRGQPGTGE